MNKEFKSVQKYLVMSPRKLRIIAAMAKKLSPASAVERLPFVARRASEPLIKSIKSALAQARSAGNADSDIIFKEIQVNEGPRLKRGKAASRGRYHAFKRRMSHIRVVLTTTKSEVPSTKLETSSKDKNPKSKTELVKQEKEKEVKS